MRSVDGITILELYNILTERVRLPIHERWTRALALRTSESTFDEASVSVARMAVHAKSTRDLSLSTDEAAISQIKGGLALLI